MPTSFSLTSQGGLTRQQVEEAIAFVREQDSTLAPWFGVPDATLPPTTKPWAAYLRQSSDKQAGNNAFFGYLTTCGQIARDRRTPVPLSLIFYDDETGAHMDRPAMNVLRHEYIEMRRIAGVIIPDLWRLTRDVDHLGIFEKWCEHYEVEYWYGGGVPNGPDPYAKMARRTICEAGTLQRNSINRGNLEGRLARVRRGSVPPGKLPLGYRMVKQCDSSGRVLDAQWVPEGLLVAEPVAIPQLHREADLAAYFAPGSPAAIVGRIFFLSVVEGWTASRIATLFQEEGVPTPEGGKWSHVNVAGILRNTVYYGEGTYNRGRQVANPERKMALDMTSAPSRTVRRLKPSAEHVSFTVPPLITRATYDLAQERLTYHRQHRGQSVPQSPALLRGLMYCPACYGPMRLWHHSDRRWSYYRCSNSSRQDAYTHCTNKVMVRQDRAEAFVLERLRWLVGHPDELRAAAERQQGPDMHQTLRMQVEVFRQSVEKLERRKARVREGWENGLYDTVADAQAEMRQVRDQLEAAQGSLAQAEEAVRRYTGEQLSVEGLIAWLEEYRRDGLDQLDHASAFLQKAQAFFIPTSGSRTGEGQLGFRNLWSADEGGVVNEVRFSLTFFRDTNRILLVS